KVQEKVQEIPSKNPRGQKIQVQEKVQENPNESPSESPNENPRETTKDDGSSDDSSKNYDSGKAKLYLESKKKNILKIYCRSKESIQQGETSKVTQTN
ncbi:25714_t:CDS:2, partial [Racocetra persica]